MRAFYILLPIFVISLSSSSCIFSDLFGGNNGAFVADTVILAPNIDHIEVQTVTSDSSYTMISYWTDEDGRPLYMKARSYFVNGVKDGREERWKKGWRPKQIVLDNYIKNKRKLYEKEIRNEF